MAEQQNGFITPVRTGVSNFDTRIPGERVPDADKFIEDTVQNTSRAAQRAAAVQELGDAARFANTRDEAQENTTGRLRSPKTGIGSNPTPATGSGSAGGFFSNLFSRFTGFFGLSSADNAEVAQRNNSEVTNTQPFEIEVRNDQLTIPDNPLLDFVNMQYHISLSMIPEPNIVPIQQRIPQGGEAVDISNFDQLQQELLREGSVPFASTGDVFDAELSVFEDEIADEFGVSSRGSVTRFVDGRHYYAIESLEFDNALSPTPQNPFINAMLTGKMTIVEPHGFKLHEDIRRIANRLQYKGINAGRIMWRIDIFFSGYNQDTGQWHPFIEIDVRNRKTKILTYYVSLTTVEAKVTHTGTTYDVSFAPAGHSAYRPEEVQVDAGAISTGAGETFGGFLDQLETMMNDAVRARTNDQVKRKFEFKAPAQLREASFFTGDFAVKHNYLKNDPKGGSAIPTGRDVNAITIVEEALQDLQLTWDNMLKRADRKHLRPRVHWGIRFNVIYDSGPSPGLNDYSVITNQYIIEPFITYKNTTMNNRDDLQQVVAVDSQVERVKEMIRRGMINRIYNYIHTAENLEVIEVDLSLKNFYYHTLFNRQDTPGGAGIMQAEGAATQNANRQSGWQEVDERGTARDDAGAVVAANRENTVDNTLRRLFGSSIDTPAQQCDNELFSTPFDVLGGGFGEMPKVDAHGAISSSDQTTRDEYTANLNDHIRNDLIKIDMQVLGDPVWLLTPYGTETGNVLASPDRVNNPEGKTAFVQPQSSRCMFLRMFAPNQKDYMNPERAGASTACSILGGFYEVIMAKSVFSNGKFTQVLTATKMIHLNYVENFVSIAPDSQVGTTAPSDGSVVLTNSRPNEALVGNGFGFGTEAP